MKKKTIFVVLVPLVVILSAGIFYRGFGKPFLASANKGESCTDQCEHEIPAAGKPDHDGAEEGHAGHNHGEEKVVVLTEAQCETFGVETGKAGPGKIEMFLTLPGEVTVNADRVAHIVPRVPGVVREVQKNLGDRVKKGEVLAVLESRELADAKAGFLAARERAGLAQANFIREEQLWKKKISAEQEYLQARQSLAEAKIEVRSAEQKLHALGLSDAVLGKLPEQADARLTRYELVVPFDATIIEKHMTLGEAVKDDSEVFTIADLSSVWVTFNIHQKDLPMVHSGQPVIISGGHGIAEAQGNIAYLGPIIGEQTRTTPVRVVLANPKGDWRPGLFVTGRVLVESVNVPILVPKEAVIMIEGKPVVFVKDEDGFEPKSVVVGRSNDQWTEIVSGLSAGQSYAAKGAYTLKLELNKFKGDPCGGH